MNSNRFKCELINDGPLSELEINRIKHPLKNSSLISPYDALSKIDLDDWFDGKKLAVKTTVSELIKPSGP